MFCTKCGARNEDDAKFCHACGDPLDVETAETVAQAPQPMAPPAAAQPGQPYTPPAQPPYVPPQAAAQPPYVPPQQPYVQPAASPLAPPVGVFPAEANGFSWAGFVPFGIFAFVHKSQVWAWIGLGIGAGQILLGKVAGIGLLLGLAGLAYDIYFGMIAKKIAWQSGRFQSLEQYTATMKIWNTWGQVLLAVGIVLAVMGTCAAMMAAQNAANYWGNYNF